VSRWLGLDFGTSSAKAIVVDDSGRALARARTRYALMRGQSGEFEQDARAYVAALRRLARALPELGRITGVGIVGQNPTLVFLDASLRPVRPAMTWQDMRAAAEADELAARLGDPVAHFGTSLAWAPTNAPAKLLWLSRHEPHTRDQTRWIVQPKDFVGIILTGEVASDPWISKGLCNVETQRPPAKVFEIAGWSTDVVPPLAPAWTIRGRVSKSAAQTFGIPAGVPVAIGWSDALAPLLAAGAFTEPSAFVSTGTSDVAGVSANEVPRDARPLYSVPATCAPIAAVYGPTQAAGGSVDWVARTLGVSARRIYEMAAAARTTHLPAFVPYVAGERAPVWRSDVRAAFMGLDIHHGPPELARAAVLGAACSDRHVLEAAEAIVGRADGPVLVAGASGTSEHAHAIRASVIGRPLRVLAEPEASALAGAMLGASAAGMPLSVAVSSLMGERLEVEPSPNQIDDGEAAYARYLRASRAAIQWADEAAAQPTKAPSIRG
jgi:xylulokinase